MSMNLVGIAGLGDPVVPVAPHHRPGYVRYSVGTEAELPPLTDEEIRAFALKVMAIGGVTLGVLVYAGYRFIKWEEAQHRA
jgi:hypothetical protein